MNERPAPIGKPAGWRLFLAASLVALALLVFFAGHFLLLAFAAILAAIAIAGGSTFIARTLHLRYVFGLLLLLVLLAAALAALSLWVLPPLTDQMGQLVAKIPDAERKLRAMLQHTPWLQSLLGKGGADGQATGVSVGELAGIASTAASSLLGTLGEALVVLVAAIYLAAQPHLYIDGAVRLVVPARRQRLRRTLELAGQYLRWWMIGQSFAMATVGLLTGLAFWLLGMPLAFALALIAGLLTFIPYLGVFLSLVPAEMVALTQTPMMPIYVAAVFLVNHLVEGYLLEPLIQRRMISFPPALLLLAQVALWYVAGLLGVLIATPLAILAMAIIRIWYVETVIEPAEARG